jgi:beta-phosphoglucomutase-like phosphatase (HAD superfamily)
MTIRALLWDLDGTLVDSEPLHARATELALAELGLATPQGFHDRALGLAAAEVHAALVAETALSLPAEAWEALKWARYAALAPALPTREPAATLAARFAGSGVAQAVVSNSSRAEVDLALAATGLAAHLPFSIARDDVRRGKPDPEGYLAAAHRLGVEAGRCVVVEDSLAGARAGLAAGMAVIFHPQTPLPGPEGAVTLPPHGDLGATLEALHAPT